MYVSEDNDMFHKEIVDWDVKQADVLRGASAGGDSAAAAGPSKSKRYTRKREMRYMRGE